MIRLTDQELRELLNMNLKSALGSVTQADSNTIVERLHRCMEFAKELHLRQMERPSLTPGSF